MTGAVLELLAAETYRNVTEMYFEEALNHKYSRDDASCRMLDLIIANIDINFGYTNSGLIFLLRNMIRDNDNNLASKYASSEKSYITSLEDTLKSYAKIAA
jgi:hypothetical protein